MCGGIPLWERVPEFETFETFMHVSESGNGHETSSGDFPRHVLANERDLFQTQEPREGPYAFSQGINTSTPNGPTGVNQQKTFKRHDDRTRSIVLAVCAWRGLIWTVVDSRHEEMLALQALHDSERLLAQIEVARDHIHRVYRVQIQANAPEFVPVPRITLWSLLTCSKYPLFAQFSAV